MTQPAIPIYKTSRKIAGVAIAVGAAIATPFLAGFCSVLIFPTLVCALLYAFGGMVPAAAAMLTQVMAFGLLGGIPGGIIAAAGIVLPAAYTIRSLRFRMPFFKLLTHTVAAQMLGIVAALTAARLYFGADLVGQLAELFRTSFEMFLTPGSIDYLLDMFFDIEAVPEVLTTQQLMDGILTPELRADYLTTFVGQISATLRLTLPGMLLSASLLTGILTAAWPAKIIDRRINVPHAYVKLARWYTPWQVSVGLLATWAIAWILEALGMNGGDVLYLTLQSLLLMVFRIQAAISLERRLTRGNVQPALRVLIIIGAMLLVPSIFLMYYGAFSAFFGSTGAMLQIRILRGKNDPNGGNDSNNDENNDFNNRQEDK